MRALGGRAGRHHRRSNGSVGVEQGLDLATQRGEALSLDEERVGAAGHRQLLRLEVVESGHRHDPRRLGRWRFLDPPAYFEAVEPGHAEIEQEQIGLERADSQESFVTAARPLDARAGHEIPDRVDRQLDEVLLVVDHQDPRTITGLGAEAERRLKPLELARADPEVPAGRPEGFELSGLDPVLDGAHRHLAPARDLTRRQIPHGDLKMAAIPQNSTIPVVADPIFYPN